ncbi:MAG: rhomboid family intramembrane serine protease [Prochloraceae cyanobacterium]|nr:rhomboid family intramembrane serine protease [Prochloraceae cyanobacterium]
MNNKNPLKAYATHGLIGINLLFFAAQFTGGTNDLSTLYQLGLGPQAVLGGQWWRLLSANFLHFGWVHLFSNMLGLYFIGRFVEINLGVRRYLLAYFISGIGSMLAFTILAIKMEATNQILVGASAAIMGLIGVICAIFFRIWQRKKSRYAFRRLSILLFTIGVQFAFDLAMPRVSFLSHVLGLVIGFITGATLLNDKDFKV